MVEPTRGQGELLAAFVAKFGTTDAQSQKVVGNASSTARAREHSHAAFLASSYGLHDPLGFAGHASLTTGGIVKLAARRVHEPPM